MVRFENPMYMKPYYPWWRLDKNICWYNLDRYVCGLMYGLVTGKIFKEEYKYLLRLGRVWLPPLDGRRWI